MSASSSSPSPPPLCDVPDPRPRRPNNTIPPGACDCHFHIFDEPSPQVAERSYTAPTASTGAYRALQQTLGLERAVIVQPSIYGTDNRTTLQSMPEDGSMRAVVVVDDDASVAELKALAAQGAVGVRINMLFASNAQLQELSGLTAKMADLGWHLQVLADVSALPDLAGFVAGLPVPVVFDHMGHVPVSKGVHDAGFQTLLGLLDGGDVWVKLSGAYRMTATPSTDYADVAPQAEALIGANPDRMVWGSDWPHPSFGGDMPNDGDLLDLLFDWAGTERAAKILVDNPQRLYGFPAVSPGN